MAVPRHLRGRSCLLLVMLFLRLPTGFLPQRGPGQRDGPVSSCRPARRCAGRTVAGHGRGLFPARPDAKRTSTPSSPWSAAAAAPAARTAARMYMNLSDCSTSATAARTAPRRSPSARRRRSAALRDAKVFALVPPRSAASASRPASRCELQNSGGLTREQFEAVRDAAARRGQRGSHARQVRVERLPGLPTLKVDIDQREAGRRSGSDSADVNSDPVDRLGRALRQRFHRPRPGQARLCPGRRALSLGARRPGPLVRAQRHRARWCPFSVLRRDPLDRPRRRRCRRFNGVSVVRDPGPGSAGRQLRRRDGRDGRARRQVPGT